jgi:hypothetical protein
MNLKIGLLLFLTLIFARLTFAQNCDCDKEFLFIKDFIEKNYAGFNDKVTDINKQTYIAFSEDILKQTQTVSNSNYCYWAIQNWLNYFNDGHTRLIPKPLKSISDSIEEILLTPELLSTLENKSVNDVEGIYLSQYKGYKIAIIKNETNFRDYVGIIISAKSKSWKAGQVKVELKHIEKDKYNALYYLGNHQPSIMEYTIKDGKFNPKDFIKSSIFENLTQNDNEPFSKLENKSKAVYYKDIDDSTAYLRIKSFHDRFAKKIISEIKSNEHKIKSKPYLIIDVRYNGGGSDFSYSPLLPFIYTNPIKTVGTDVFSTPDNIKSWQKVIDENPKLPEDVKKSIADVITQMSQNPTKFINIGNDEIDTTLQVAYVFPRKVAILIDEDCASSTEQFLLAAKQSKKVIIFGKPTVGVLDYSNMRTVDLNCMPYLLGYSTSRSRRIPENAIDNTGILPDVVLNFDKIWLEEVLNILKNRNRKTTD